MVLASPYDKEFVTAVIMEERVSETLKNVEPERTTD